MRKLKTKKLNLEQINEQFQEEIRSGAERFFFYLNDFIDDKLDAAKQKFEEMIVCEEKCDNLKDKYIQLLFKEKRALPFLVEDRHNIITSLDKILNKYEYLSRYLQIFPFKIYPDIREDLKEYNKLNFETINQLLNCTLLMESNFSGAYEITFEIEKLRKEAHNLKFKILGTIFKKNDEPLRVNLTWKIISLIYDIIAWAEQISDYLRGLIIKYPSR